MSTGLAIAAVVVLAGLGAASTYLRYGYSATPPPRVQRSAGEAFTFVAFGDIEDDVVGFEDLVGRVGERGAPDFGVVLGDVTKRCERARESYVAYFAMLRRLRPSYPIVTVPGNHDRPVGSQPDEYQRAFGPLNWWFVHAGCVFVGVDNADGRLMPEARRVLREAGAAASPTTPVFLFVHVPIWGPDGSLPPATARRESLARESITVVRQQLGVPLTAVFAAHTDLWSSARDELGTLHVCCGAEQGLGWPAGSTPQVAAICKVSGGQLSVTRVRVPYRSALGSSVRQAGHLYLYSRLRALLEPIPVWCVALLAAMGWWVSSRRSLRAS